MANNEYTFKMEKRDHCTYTVDVMTMWVKGKQVGYADVVNIHETFAERMAQVRAQLIWEHENR